MSDRVLTLVVIASIVAMFGLTAWTAVDRDHMIRQRDIARSQVDDLNLQMIRGCVAHPDGSGECKPGTFPTTTTIAVP